MQVVFFAIQSVQLSAIPYIQIFQLIRTAIKRHKFRITAQIQSQGILFTGHKPIVPANKHPQRLTVIYFQLCQVIVGNRHLFQSSILAQIQFFKLLRVTTQYPQVSKKFNSLQRLQPSSKKVTTTQIELFNPRDLCGAYFFGGSDISVFFKLLGKLFVETGYLFLLSVKIEIQIPTSRQQQRSD